LARIQWRRGPPGIRHRAGILARPASQTRIFTAQQGARCIASMHRVIREQDTGEPPQRTRRGGLG